MLVQKQKTESPLRIDIGCGGAKREGFVGLDNVPGPQVDFVLDLTKDRFPFEDETVDEVFSSHFLEHIRAPFHVLKEISRVCKDGAKIEFWTPYAFSNDAFVFGHETILTEEPWLHLTYHFRDTWNVVLNGRWQFQNINFVVAPETEKELVGHGFTIDFAVRYFKSVVMEFGVEFEFTRDMAIPALMPKRTYSHTRYGPRFPLQPVPMLNILERDGRLPESLRSWVPAGVRRRISRLLRKH